MEKRGSGVLLHISSLPSAYGVGDLGAGARHFIDFLAAAGQKYWQFLPIGPCCRVFDNSPYMSLSAFAGNPLFIDPAQLAGDGFISEGVLRERPEFSEYLVDFDAIIPFKTALLRHAHERFRKQQGADEGFLRFCRAEAEWLDDYALFQAIRGEQRQGAWSGWPTPLAARRPDALAEARRRLAVEIDFHCFVQYIFYKQWRALQHYARDRHVALIGDIPIYVSYDSADVWAHRDCFRLDDRSLLPTHVAGVPPDYFSATGQRWGNPLYCWQKNGVPHQPLYAWWRSRFHQIFRTVDIVRIDHFRGFESYWEIDADEETALNGRWVKGPGQAFFDAMAAAIGTLPIIAEDLGLITPEVETLRTAVGFPGMKVLQFAFDSDAANLYLPHNYQDPNCVVYTGTHDNDTTVGWYLSPGVAEGSKSRARRYANSSGEFIHWDFIRMAFASVARTAIVPLQDLLGFGSDCRMNKPSTDRGNWRWRCAPRFLSGSLAERLRDETAFYGRL